MPKSVTYDEVAPSVARLRRSLVQAHSAGVLVRFERSVENGCVNGYVSLVGAELFVVCVVSDDVRFNGFQAFRFADVTKVFSPAPHHAFVKKALALRKLRRPADPALDLTDTMTLLTSANAAFPLVTIHRELVDSDVCQVGRVVKVSTKTVTLREITPDATWERKRHRYLLSDITQVGVGGAYEDALHAVNQVVKRRPSNGRGTRP